MPLVGISREAGPYGADADCHTSDIGHSLRNDTNLMTLGKIFCLII